MTKQKSKKKRSKKKEVTKYFVEIEDPSELRKDVLISVKDLLDSLKRYEQYEEMDAKKHELISELKKKNKEILTLNKKLRSMLPKLPAEEPGEKEEEFVPEAPKTGGRHSKLEQIEEELADIESKLSALE